MRWTILKLVRFKEKLFSKLYALVNQIRNNNDDSLNYRSAVKGMPHNLDVKLVLAEVYEDLREDAKALELVDEGECD
jgi:hypothetical protein